MNDTRTSLLTNEHSNSKRSESDDEGSEIAHIKRKSSIPKLLSDTLRRRTSSESVRLKEKEAYAEKHQQTVVSLNQEKPDYHALLEAAESKHRKKVSVSTTYASKKQLCEQRIEYLKQLAVQTDQLDVQEKQLMTLSCRMDRFEREIAGLRASMSTERQEREAGDLRESSSTCSIMDWFS